MRSGSWSWNRVVLLLAGLFLVTMSSATVVAQEGVRHESAIGVRATPIGLNVLSDTGYRHPLFDSESLLLKGTYVDGGLTTGLSPAYLWFGPYLEVVPVAVLKLRVTAMQMNYFGSFGHIYMPGEDAPGDWSLDRLKESEDAGAGISSRGWMLEGRATPQIRLGRIVAFGETRLTRISLDMAADYYEPYFDMYLEPTDNLWITRPTVGYLLGEDLSHSYLLLAGRWERAWTSGSGVTRDTVGLVFAWKVPPNWVSFGKPTVSGFGGVFLDHPNRGTSPYFGTQITLLFDTVPK